MITTTKWIAEHRFESNHEGNSILLDSKREKGHGPKALLLSGLAGCTGVDMVDILGKMRVNFTTLEITAEAELADDHPKIFTKIHVTYRFTSDEADREKITKAIDLSLDKYCGVAAMLKKSATISYALVIQ